MGLTRRAALLSGLVFPGIGQWMLGDKKKAVSIVLSELFLVPFLMYRIFYLVYNTLVPSGDITQMKIDPDLIQKIHRMAYVDNWWLLAIILGIWIYSIVDAVIVGKKLEKVAQ